MAPATLRLRRELSLKSQNVADLKHGEHLRILDVQRRMVKVETDRGADGWVDSALLLSADQWKALQQKRAAQMKLPSQGSATAYELLNIHIDPDRQSPAFAQIAEGGAVAVLGRAIAVKNTVPHSNSGLVIQKPQPPSRKQRKEQQGRLSSLRLPPKPKAPKPPANWQALSAERIDSGEETPEAVKPMPMPAATKPKPPVLESWTLVRSKKGEIGWVLSRNLLMAIPDDVAQYAEGKQITSFFDLGVVNDEVKGAHHNWLWTTASRGAPYDFDAWRVFLWNMRKHRFETSYRKRDLEGYFPVTVETPANGSPIRQFALITKDDDGQLRKRSYTFDGHLVHLTNTEAYMVAGPQAVGGNGLDADGLAAKSAKAGWLLRQWRNLRHLWGRE